MSVLCRRSRLHPKHVPDLRNGDAPAQTKPHGRICNAQRPKNVSDMSRSHHITCSKNEIARMQTSAGQMKWRTRARIPFCFAGSFGVFTVALHAASPRTTLQGLLHPNVHPNRPSNQGFEVPCWTTNCIGMLSCDVHAAFHRSTTRSDASGPRAPARGRCSSLDRSGAGTHQTSCEFAPRISAIAPPLGLAE